ncbi:hypothetical protein T03_10769 [Trichinella britovi]|uniref:Uncharacterized protein n=1 Tax=Trichinella britovi TaxID=45882 RepID=A0A0V1CWE5_TRIBR|nr:hypothetical protein T03_10769 [Trichinella britovi]
MAISSLLYSFVLTSNLKKLILIIQNLYYTIVLESKKGFFFRTIFIWKFVLGNCTPRSQLDPTPGILWNVNTTGPVDLTLIRDAWLVEHLALC